LHRLAPALAELVAIEWDSGNEHFPPTTFQVSNIHAGTGVENVIPGRLELMCNFRFSTELDADTIMARVAEVLTRHHVDHDIAWRLSGAPFLSTPGALTGALGATLESLTGEPPELSTSGGTSDGRFIAPAGAEVVEFGPLNATIHKLDERVAITDLDRLHQVYLGVLERLLG
jgi:succinyl-diaminopimelate desuccinylase